MHYTSSICFFFNDTATTEIYTLSLHDALPICDAPGVGVEHRHDRHRDVLDAQAEGVGCHHAHGVQERRAVRVDDALGVAGGAARVAHVGGRVLVRDAELDRLGVGEERLVVEDPRVVGDLAATAVVHDHDVPDGLHRVDERPQQGEHRAV